MESKNGIILIYARLSKKSGHTERSPDVFQSGRSRSVKFGAASPSTSFAQNAHCAQADQCSSFWRTSKNCLLSEGNSRHHGLEYLRSGHHFKSRAFPTRSHAPVPKESLRDVGTDRVMSTPGFMPLTFSKDQRS